MHPRIYTRLAISSFFLACAPRDARRRVDSGHAAHHRPRGGPALPSRSLPPDRQAPPRLCRGRQRPIRGHGRQPPRPEPGRLGPSQSRRARRRGRRHSRHSRPSAVRRGRPPAGGASPTSSPTPTIPSHLGRRPGRGALLPRLPPLRRDPRRPRFPVVFYGLRRLGRDGRRRLLAGALRRGRRALSGDRREYRRIGYRRASADFDDRSTAFARRLASPSATRSPTSPGAALHLALRRRRRPAAAACGRSRPPGCSSTPARPLIAPSTPEARIRRCPATARAPALRLRQDRARRARPRPLPSSASRSSRPAARRRHLEAARDGGDRGLHGHRLPRDPRRPGEDAPSRGSTAASSPTALPAHTAALAEHGIEPHRPRGGESLPVPRDGGQARSRRGRGRSR